MSFARRVVARPMRWIGVLLVVVVLGFVARYYFTAANIRTHYVARNAALRAMPLYFYPATDTSRPPKAVVFFFGNDVGFWQPHHQFAAIMAADGYATAGYDMKPMLAALPETEPARDSAFAVQIAAVIASARQELGAANLPLIIGGHSIGAEVAIWVAAHSKVPGVIGVLAASPGSRSHLRVSASDITMSSEPTDAESFAVSDAVRAMPPFVRLAIIRGGSDKYRFADSALLAAGGTRVKRFGVPLASHSLRDLFVAQFVVRNALSWLQAR